MSFRYIFGAILLVLGLVFLLNNFTDVWWLQWHYLWPIILILLGAWIIFRGRRR